MVRRTIIAVLCLALMVSMCACRASNTDRGSSAYSVAEKPVQSAPSVVEADVIVEPEPEAVPEPEPEPPYVAVERLTLDKYEVNLVQGQKDMPRVTMHPVNATNLAEIWTSSNEAVATVNGYGRITGVGVGSCTVTVRSADNSAAFADVAITVTPYVAPPEPQLTYINSILIANKTYALPSTYNPGVDPAANAALQQMFADAAAQGLNLFVRSGFRSYNTQKSLYDSYVRRDGKAAADRYSARAGHSEHQTGLAFDINKANSSFEGTPEAAWLAANCHRYGFIIRYPKGKEHITGYIYEPWHVRYLGVDTATAVYNSGLTLEEYLGITSVYS